MMLMIINIAIAKAFLLGISIIYKKILVDNNEGSLYNTMSGKFLGRASHSRKSI